MTKKEELLRLVDDYENDYDNYYELRRMQFFGIFFFFLGGFLLFIKFRKKRQKLNDKREEIKSILNSISSELTSAEFLEIRKKIMLTGRI